MEQGEVLGIRVDGDAWSNRLTRLMAMHKAIDLQKGGWMRAGSVRFWKNDYSTLDRGFDLALKWLSNVHFNSCINRWIKNERINIIHFMGEGYIGYEWGLFMANKQSTGKRGARLPITGLMSASEPKHTQGWLRHKGGKRKRAPGEISSISCLHTSSGMKIRAM